MLVEKQEYKTNTAIKKTLISDLAATIVVQACESYVAHIFKADTWLTTDFRGGNRGSRGRLSHEVGYVEVGN